MLMAKLRSSVHSRAQASPSLAATQKELKAGTHKGPKPSAAVVGLSSQRPLTHLAEPQDHPIIHEFSGVQRGALHKRYKRFLGDVSFAGKAGNELEGGANPPLTGGSTTSEVTVSLGSTAGHALEGGANPPLAEDSSAVEITVVHVANTGPMTGLLDRPLAPVVCSTSTSKTRKYRHTLELIQPTTGGAWVGVHSALANKIVRKLLEDGHLEGILGSYTVLQSEVAVGQASPNPSRLDFMLTRKNGKRMYIEVKSATLSEPMKGESPETNIALFPDTVSTRALKHMKEIANLVKDGHEAACVFLIQRGDCTHFAPCHEKDPVYAAAVQEAAQKGVKVVALRCGWYPASQETDGTAVARYLGPAEVLLGYQAQDWVADC